MHVYYKFGLFLIFILSVSTCYTRAAPATNKTTSFDDDYPDDYDDYYDEHEGDAQNSSTSAHGQLSAEITTTTTTTHKPLFSFLEFPSERSNHVLEPDCPKACLCLEDYKHIKCSNARLTHVPPNIPSTALILDLSQNYIGELRAEEFANCSKLREINLSHNELTEINGETFEGLWRLKRLYLANNHLRRVQPNTFAGANDLDILDLSNNIIHLPSEGSFLNQPNLLELSCRNCSWSTLYDETFANLSRLTALKLDQNDFNKKINTKAFTPLRNLIKLKLPELDQASVQELCNLLKSIDNISFRHFDVSCFELVLGATFNESLIFATDPPYRTPDSATETETKPQKSAERDSNRSAGMSTNDSAEVNSNLTLNNGGEPNILTAGVVATATVPTGVVNGGGDQSEKTYQVPISQETIKIMLIAIMVVAVICIIIGIICRKDVGGIKTKCCRTRKPEPKDQVHPTEEIPLNKLA